MTGGCLHVKELTFCDMSYKYFQFLTCFGFMPFLQEEIL